MGENPKLVRAEFSALSYVILLCRAPSVVQCRHTATSRVESRLRFKRLLTNKLFLVFQPFVRKSRFYQGALTEGEGSV